MTIPADAAEVFVPVVPTGSLPVGTRRTVKLVLLPDDASYTVSGPDRAKVALTGGQ